jgi:hypothetical protein
VPSRLDERSRHAPFRWIKFWTDVFKQLKTDQCVKAWPNDYWNGPEFRDKRPVRNGSKKMLVGDNIYFYDAASIKWHQADSHHSNEDGSVNLHNLKHDTKVDAVLVSDRFYYFGDLATWHQ